MKTKGAVIGVGYLGKFHAQKYAQLTSQVDFVGVCDGNQDAANKIATDLRVTAFRDINELIGEVDAVTLATPTTTHYSIAKKLIENGIHVLIEKPIAATVEQAEELEHLAQKKGVIVQVGHIERFNPAFQALLKQVTSPSGFQAIRLAPFKPRALDVDVVVDLMIHDIDLMLTVMKDDPIKVAASGSRSITSGTDESTAVFTFSKNRSASIAVSRCSPHAVRTVSVFQKNMHLLADLGSAQLTKVQKDLSDPKGLTALTTVESVEKYDAMLEETKSFFAAVQGLSPSPVPAKDGIRALKVLESVLRQISEPLS